MTDYHAMALDDARAAILTGFTLYEDADYPPDDAFVTPAEARWDMLYAMLAVVMDTLEGELPEIILAKSKLSAVYMEFYPARGAELGREVQACRDAFRDMALADTKALLLAAERIVHERYEKVRVM